MKKEGLLVFINSKPVKEKDFIATHQTTVFETINNLLSKAEGETGVEKVLDKIQDFGKVFAFEKKLSEELRKIKEEYADADGVIFDDKLNQCEVFKFR